jgi:thiol-disulfide isomerase/thioredoxin
MALFERVHLPSFAGATEWLNSEPLGPAELRGRVVLVNFWTWTCINWLRQEPYVRAWSHAYRDDGLIVIGVHTPEFAFEHDVDGLRRATRERAIDYPVAVDNEYEVWSAFANHYWPALYFADREGVIRDHHFGEGRYEKLERVIQQLLGIEREPVIVEGQGVEAAADWDNLRTHETYLGSSRSGQFGAPPSAMPDHSRLYTRPEGLRLGHWALAGEWTIRPEYVVLDQAGGSIAFRFHARDAHLVLSREAPEPIPFRVRLDGEAPGRSHGVDIDEDGNGVLRNDRVYQLVRQHDAVRDRRLEITFLQPRARAHSFTFG